MIRYWEHYAGGGWILLLDINYDSPILDDCAKDLDRTPLQQMFDQLVNTVVQEHPKHLNMATATVPVTRELVDTKEGAVQTTGAEAEDPPKALLKTITMSAWHKWS